MRISGALAKARDIVVEFENDVLHVAYRPAGYSVEQLEKLADEDGQGGRKVNPNRIIEMMQQMIVKWDLTEDDGKAIEISDTARMRQVPTSIFTTILSAVKADQSTGEASRPSSAS